MRNCSFMAMQRFIGWAEVQMPQHGHGSALHARDYARAARLHKTCCRHPSKKTGKSEKRGTAEREGSVLLTANTRQNRPTAGCQGRSPENIQHNVLVRGDTGEHR